MFWEWLDTLDPWAIVTLIIAWLYFMELRWGRKTAYRDGLIKGYDLYGQQQERADLLRATREGFLP